jgi:hypothetical protein
MFTKGVPAELASAHNFHPEFGYLCPTAALRRKLRGAAVTVLAGTMIAAGAVLALAPPHPSGDSVRVEPVLSARAEPVLSAMAVPSIDKADKAQESAPATAGATIVAPVTGLAATARAQATCDDLAGSFLAARCQFGKIGKAHSARTARPASNRIASVPIGRAGPGPEAGLQVPAASHAAPPVETVAADPAEVAANEASPLPSAEKREVPAKKPVKMAHKPVPGHDVASVDPSRGFNLFGPFHDQPRTGNGAWNISWATRPSAR